MPSWKKVITSGSDAALNSLNVTTSVTASIVSASAGLITDNIQFNTGTSTVVQPGQLAWNSSDGTLDLGLKGGNVTLQVGQETLYEVRNATGVTISNGTALYASGVTAGSGRIEASPFTADGSIREVRFLGLATENIGIGVNGFVTHFGYTRGLDTRGTAVTAISVGDENWSVGDVLYAHPTAAGKLTKVRPKHEISVAIVIVRHQSTGVLFVRPASYGHMDDIHDVNINTGSLATGDLLIYDSGSDYWINSKQLSGSYGITGSLTVNGTVSGSTLYSSQHVVAAENLKSMFSSGDEGGEIFLSKAATNTTIDTGVTIDINRNKLRIFENGGTNRGGYYDITALGAGVGTNLLGGSGTVTQVDTAGNVNGITLTGGPITGTGTVTLGGTLSGIGNAQLTNSSITVGSTSISLGSSATTIAGLSSVTSTSFTGSLLGNASTSTSASYATTASYVGSLSANITNNTNNYVLTATGGSTVNGEANLTFNGSLLSAVGNIRASYAANSSNISLQPDFAQVYLVASSNDSAFGDKKMVINSTGLSLRAMGSSTPAMEILSGGNVGIGVTNPSSKLHVYSSGEISRLESSTTTMYQTFRANGTDVGYIGNGTGVISGGSATDFGIQIANNLVISTGGSTERMRITSTGLVGIGTSSPSYKTDISGSLRFSTGYLNSDNCFEKIFPNSIGFPDGTANLAVDIILGNISFWGYIEVEVVGAYTNQATSGKLTKIFAVGTNPGNLIYVNESRVSDAIGAIDDNIAIGDMSWDATNSRYRIPISHIVSTGNPYTVRVKMFTHDVGAKNVFDNISIGSNYTLTALAKQYPYYNDRLGIGTSSPGAKLHVAGEGIFDDNTYGRLTLGFASSQNDIYSTTTGFGAYKDLRYTANNHIFRYAGLEVMRITNGNVGIGTSSPSSILHLNSAVPFLSIQGSTSASLRGINIMQGSTVFSSLSAEASLGETRLSAGFSEWGGFQTFYTNGSEKMRITSDGNVGIGTSSPNALLDVNGDALINRLTIGQGPAINQQNTAIGRGALGSMSLAYANIALGHGSNTDNDSTGLTTIGVELNTNTNLDPLLQDCLAISQYNSNAYSNQVPHIYAPKPVSIPNNTTTDIITFDVEHYAGAIVEYIIRYTDGGDYAMGTVYMAWKTSGSGNFKDIRAIEWNNMSGFNFDTNGGPTLSLINSTGDDAWVRITVRGMMTN